MVLFCYGCYGRIIIGILHLMAMLQLEYEFTLPKGYLDADGNLHRKGMMRLSRAIDEIVPMRDPRVKANPAYATVLILARVITRLGALEEVSPAVIEELFAVDLSFYSDFIARLTDYWRRKRLPPLAMAHLRSSREHDGC